MPKNKGKGGKNRRRGKNENEQTKRELDLKEEGQEYAQVMKILGNEKFDHIAKLKQNSQNEYKFVCSLPFTKI